MERAQLSSPIALKGLDRLSSCMLQAVELVVELPLATPAQTQHAQFLLLEQKYLEVCSGALRHLTCCRASACRLQSRVSGTIDCMLYFIVL